MKKQGVNLIETFDYHEELLSAALQHDWLSRHTEPPEEEHDEIDRTVEERMAEFVCQDCAVKACPDLLM